MSVTAAPTARRIARLAAAGLVLAASWLPGGAAASVAPPGAERVLSFLEDTVGQYPRDVGLWEHALMHRRMSALLGRRLPFFRSNMWNTTPVLRQGHLIYVLGTRRPLAGQDSAVFVADLRSDTVWVWVMISGQMFEYRERLAQPELPAEVALFLANWRSSSRATGAPPVSYQ